MLLVMTSERELKTLAHGRGKGKPVLTKGETSPPFQRDQCANCKKKTHWKNECPKRNPREDSKVLELEELDDLGYWGSTLHREPRVTLKVEGKPIDFLVDTGAQHSVLKQLLGPLSNQKTWVQGATDIKPYPWTTRRKVDL